MKTSDADLLRLSARVGRHLLRTARRATTAESCTGGWIAKALTDIPGSSQWFLEGFVTYDNQAKSNRLGVSPTLIEREGAVSRSVACAMARGALLQTDAQLSVAVTGIAGPGGAVPGKPVGTVWLAWAIRRGRRVLVSAELKRFRGDRDAVRRKTVWVAMSGMLRR